MYLPDSSSDTPIAYHDGRYYCAEQFYHAVSVWTQRFQAQSAQNYALYTEDAYPFAVLLFALFHAQKTVWIPSNNRPATAQQLQHCQLIGDWDNPAFAYDLDTLIVSKPKLPPLNPVDAQLIIFTSGSTGEPKPIPKTLAQLQRECVTLENVWGQQLDNAEVLSTVSHQHIYGLLFRILWSLSAGRCFHSSRYLNPETLIKHSVGKVWIASPAQLKRLTADSPWTGITELTAIFSSGGVLPASAAQQLLTHARQAVIEVYGSSETGGIAWRQQTAEWTLFAGMKLTLHGDSWQLDSPYLSDSIMLDDSLSLQTDGRFLLNGRLDRLVKVEEKRLSLTELEHCLTATPLISEAFTVLLTHRRDIIAAAVVLNETGQQLLAKHGRNYVIQKLRAVLHDNFEAVLLPRKWLFMNYLPMNTQGKIDHALLMQLLNSHQTNKPQLQSVDHHGDHVELQLKIPANLIYFPDHFANHPILAGVVQLAWVEHFAKLFFGIQQSFSTMEALKFVKPIRPNDELTLTLNWKTESQCVRFSFSSAQQSYSSGRLS